MGFFYDDFIFLGTLRQAQFLLVGAVFTIAGLALLCREAFWRLRAERVQAVIAGVRGRGRVYYTVYDFVTKDGLACRATARSGSSLTGGRETGKAVDLLYFPDDPLYVRTAGFLMLSLALGCLVIGGLFLQAAVEQPYKLLYAAAIVPLLAALWFWRSARAPTPAQKQRMNETHSARDARLGPVVPMETRLDQTSPAPWTPVPAFLPHLMYVAAAVLAVYTAMLMLNGGDTQKAGLCCAAAALLVWLAGMAARDRKRWEKHFGNKDVAE
ncbi:MAG: DUF3592 domain-containing protein [Alphaproteobacteria bacterium]